MKLKPIKPFEPVRANKIPIGGDWIAQIKWDGVRMLTYYDGQVVKLYNRKLNEKTVQYPELLAIEKYCRAESVILDGELVALEHGTPSFHKIMKRDSKRIVREIERLSANIPIYYMIFDVLYLNAEWVINKPLAERLQILQEIIIPTEHIQLVQSFVDGEKVFEAVQSRGMEGIVCKDLTKAYLLDKKDDRWVKIKNYQDIAAVVGGVTLKEGIVNSIVLGLYDRSGQLHYIGHGGTGKLTARDRQELTENIKPLIIKESPFINPAKRSKEAVWLKPTLAVKVKYLEWTGGRTLRQPSIQAFIDFPTKSCTFAEEMEGNG